MRKKPIEIPMIVGIKMAHHMVRTYRQKLAKEGFKVCKISSVEDQPSMKFMMLNALPASKVDEVKALCLGLEVYVS